MIGDARCARPKSQGGDYRPHYRKREADAYMNQLEVDRDKFEAWSREWHGVVEVVLTALDLPLGLGATEAVNAILAKRVELREELSLAKFHPLGDNHHNALLCPYCSPKS